MDSSIRVQSSDGVSIQDESTTQEAHAPLQQYRDRLSFDEDRSSVWETESSKDSASSSHDDHDDDEDEMARFYALPYIERIDVRERANQRSDNDDDTWSDFSGDEKYEPRENPDKRPGGGDRDMTELCSEGGYDGSLSFHARFANSLTVTPSSMGLLDDIFTLHYAGIVRCGVLQHMKYSGFHAAPEHVIVQDPRKESHKLYTEKLQTLKATKFNHPAYGVPPAPDVYVPINEGQNQQNPLCIANNYGYMAMVAQSGDLKVYCTMSGKKPSVIHAGPLQGSSDSSMLSSVEIEGYPTKPGQFDHYLVIAGREKGLFIVALPDHPNHGNDDDSPASRYVPDDNSDFSDNNYSDANNYSDDGNYTDDDNYSAGGYVSDADDHEFRFKGDHTWIQHGFNDIPLNDARVSPNGRWIAVVGDDARVWTIEVSHVLETVEQRVAPEKREQDIMLESLGTDLNSRYAADDYLSDMQDKLRLEDDEDGPRSKRQPHESNSSAFSDLEEPAAFKNQKRMHALRLLHQFGHPAEMLIPAELVIRTPPRPCCQYGQLPDGASYSSQNVAWNSTSTKFAHSSNTSPRVYVWSVLSRQLVCCVDVGGPSFAIEFHPTLENLFAVANWYGFVHVVDLTGCCIGDKDLNPSEAYYANGEA
ncbi:hypothetical protein BGZ99_005704 [Dissophora globulifera]|uniref:Uncharacterized protein n=1 Tax=Dissophora globulifera TaxID=979702 RepID=A0A9P6RGC6_9FUNG|nr:hypothetical protein BGZ99_005704 [Dissophora globulifera]